LLERGIRDNHVVLERKAGSRRKQNCQKFEDEGEKAAVQRLGGTTGGGQRRFRGGCTGKEPRRGTARDRTKGLKRGTLKARRGTKTSAEPRRSERKDPTQPQWQRDQGGQGNTTWELITDPEKAYRSLYGKTPTGGQDSGSHRSAGRGI